MRHDLRMFAMHPSWVASVSELEISSYQVFRFRGHSPDSCFFISDVRDHTVARDAIVPELPLRYITLLLSAVFFMLYGAIRSILRAFMPSFVMHLKV